ncbi:hypothetical protein ASF35_01760 [Aeromicrobium sp. Leaf291]|nr:hypothetical protein ASF35_01760 [Aeromicrobium sp. Leaf291]
MVEMYERGLARVLAVLAASHYTGARVTPDQYADTKNTVENVRNHLRLPFSDGDTDDRPETD